MGSAESILSRLRSEHVSIDIQAEPPAQPESIPGIDVPSNRIYLDPVEAAEGCLANLREGYLPQWLGVTPEGYRVGCWHPSFPAQVELAIQVETATASLVVTRVSFSADDSLRREP